MRIGRNVSSRFGVVVFSSEREHHKKEKGQKSENHKGFKFITNAMLRGERHDMAWHLGYVWACGHVGCGRG